MKTLLGAEHRNWVSRAYMEARIERALRTQARDAIDTLLEARCPRA